MLIQCTNASCSTKNTTTLDSAAAGIYENSVDIKLASDGFPRIAYSDSQNVTYLQCTNAACTTKNTTAGLGTMTTNLTNGSPNIAMQLDSSGYARIAYVSSSSGAPITYIKCTNASCSTNTTANVTTVSTTRGSVNIALDGSDVPSLAFTENGGTDLQFVKCSSDTCSSYTTELLSKDFQNSGDSIGINARLHMVSGLPFVTAERSIESKNLYVIFIARCFNVSCSQFDYNPFIPILSKDNNDLFLVSDVTSGGMPRIAYYFDNKGSDRDLRYITCYDLLCNSTAYTSSGGVNIGSATNYFNNLYTANLYAKNGFFNGFDLAENYYVDDTSIAAGDIVAIDHGTTVKKSTSAL